ncbi:phosphopentomutase/phosphoglucosamine mutase [Halomicrobium salinisoli]|uniref:phosphopentomutase/phosphoglucosamine mutase n=1 Tax=Halomicrobium salinisoli TaxID=2878391 RepID=UPI001CF056B9|nr:phosphopentomutase/phosphoglucosamine mutase [Halomicrobium salinisoli]
MDLFGTAGIRGDVGSEVTPDLALRVGRAVASDGDEFVVGGDGRQSTPALRSAVAAGLQSGGARVVDVGRVPTPALAFASRGRRGVMITASHNPPEDNGIKLFADGTEYDREAERRVEAAVEDDEAAAWDEWGGERTESPLPAYREAVVDYAAEWGGSPTDLTAAVDCGNGMAGVATPQVLGRMGAHVQALEANVDGRFPARESKPTPETLSALRAFVARSEADLGIGHDGDADRIVVLDGDGEVVHEDTVVAILAEAYTRASAAGDPVVVTTPNASARIDECVRAAGGRVERVRLGALHEGIASARAEGGPETEVVFAAEPWKHVHPAFGGWIDGVASAAVLTALVAEHGLDPLRDPVTERPYRKVSVDCPDAAKPAVMERLETDLPERFPEAGVDTEYGVRLELPDGSWTLVRPSGTEPYVRAYAESEDVDALVETVVDAIERAVDDAA